MKSTPVTPAIESHDNPAKNKTPANNIYRKWSEEQIESDTGLFMSLYVTVSTTLNRLSTEHKLTSESGPDLRTILDDNQESSNVFLDDDGSSKWGWRWTES